MCKRLFFIFLTFLNPKVQIQAHGSPVPDKKWKNGIIKSCHRNTGCPSFWCRKLEFLESTHEEWKCSIFGSDRSSRGHNVRSSVRLVQVCLKLSIFIILTQIFKLTSCELQAVSQQLFNSHHTVRALNTFVLLFIQI